MPDTPAAVDSSADRRPRPIQDRLERAERLRVVAEAQQLGRDQGAHHSTDLFHLQHEVSQAMSLALKRAEQQAEADEAKAKARWQAACAAEQADQRQRQRHGPGRPPAFAARIDRARNAYVRASLARERAQAHRAESKALIGACSAVDHPSELQQGQAQTPAQLQTRLEALFARLEAIAEEVELSDRLGAHLAKAKRLTHRLVATLAFFFMRVNTRVQSLNLAPASEQALRNDLIPALSLQRAAARSTGAEQRHRLRALSAKRLAPLQQPAHPIQALDEPTRQYLEQVAGDCADRFQRSCSCVEGRNGFLALDQQSHHRLSPRKQQVLTALHNFAIRRPDGTTAAERFFAQPHPALFEQVLARMPWPAGWLRVSNHPQPPGLRGHVTQAQGLVEELIAAKRRDRLKIALAKTQQGDITGQDVTVLDRVRAHCRDVRCPIRQVGMTMQRPTNESKARLGGQISPRLLDDKLTHGSPDG